MMNSKFGSIAEMMQKIQNDKRKFHDNPRHAPEPYLSELCAQNQSKQLPSRSISLAEMQEKVKEASRIS